jgi:hypothetical protein
MKRELIAVVVLAMAGATSVTGCTQPDDMDSQGASQQSNAGSSGGIETDTQGDGSDYEPMGQGHHHR